ncbi:hypothetical protein NLV80_002722 [Acinetobacter baumannii]|nr:hypothetical protein [Acinetobacter baumannii]EKT9847482.1 hypothetical protein [Acinetobacter baumannii]
MKIKHLWQLKCTRLQIKVDAALQEIAGAMRWINEDALDDADFVKGGVLRALERLEIMLQSNSPNHNTSCTYQFELAFHNLQDTPELRKIYWSALGQLQFDSNDRVIPPELEECPCCKRNQDA